MLIYFCINCKYLSPCVHTMDNYFKKKIGWLSHFFVPICCVFLFPCLSFQVPHTTISYETISVPLFPESKIWFCRLAQYGSEPFSWSQCRSNHGLELQSPECHSHALATDSEQDILYSLNQTPLSNSSHFWIEATEIVWIVVAASDCTNTVWWYFIYKPTQFSG